MAWAAARGSDAWRRSAAPESRFADALRERDQGLRAEDERGRHSQRASRHLPGHARRHGSDPEEPERTQSTALWKRARHAVLENDGRMRHRPGHRFGAGRNSMKVTGFLVALICLGPAAS